MNVGSLRDQRSKWSIHNDLQLNIRGISGVKRMEKNDNSSVRRKLLLLLMFQHFRSVWNLFRKPPSLPQTFKATVFHLWLISGRFSSGFFHLKITFSWVERSYLTSLFARGAMVMWLERLLMKQEDLGSIPAQTKCFSSLLGYKELRIKWIQTRQIVCSCISK